MSFSRSKVTCVPTVNWIEKACQLPLKVKSIFCDERSVILTCYRKGAAHHRVVNSKTRDWECAALGETASFWEGVGGWGANHLQLWRGSSDGALAQPKALSICQKPPVCQHSLLLQRKDEIILCDGQNLNIDRNNASYINTKFVHRHHQQMWF